MSSAQNLTSADPATLQLTPISEYVQKAASRDSSEILSLHDEISACRALLQIYRPTIDDAIRRYNELSTANPADPNIRVILSSLIVLGDQMLDAHQKFARVAKAGAEIEVIRSTRLDSVQLLHILQQIPAIIAAVVEGTISGVVSAIQKEVEPLLTADQFKQLRRNCPYFSKQQTFTIASKVNEVTSALEHKLNTMAVPHDVTKFEDGNSDSINAGVDESIVLEMLGTVPSDGDGDAA